MGLAVRCWHAGLMIQGTLRARSHFEQKVAHCPWLRLFVGASE